MANKSIFCNVPWSNLHIYWDGSYGVCCSEKSKPYTLHAEKFNIKNYTVDEWFNLEPIRLFRRKILSDTAIEACNGCYSEESNGYESRRIRENFKSVIFTELAFDKSWQQSPWHEHFLYSQLNSGYTDLVPIDWHIDFGNKCNLACKMCNPNASSTIAAVLRQNEKFNNKPKVSWADDEQSWQNFLTSVDNTPIRRIHVMGGEPLLIKKYLEFIDYLLEKNRTEISLSFVSNGTTLNSTLIEKLKKFSSVDVEISIESVDELNDYIRLGSKVNTILKVINNLHKQQADNFQLVLRTVPQLLSVPRYHKLIEFAWNNKLIIEGIPLTRPKFMQINVLPREYRMSLVHHYEKLNDQITKEISQLSIQNGRSRATLAAKLSRECLAIIRMLQLPEPEDVEQLRKEFSQHNLFWDNAYNLDIQNYLPELSNIIKKWPT